MCMQKYFEFKAGEVACEYREGSALNLPPLVLVHGRASQMGQWRSTLDAFDALNFHPSILLLDVPGHGASKLNAPFSFPEIATVLAQVINRVCGAGVMLIGHSLGASLAQVITLQNPELIARLVLASALPLNRSYYSKLEGFVLRRSASLLDVHTERSLSDMSSLMAKDLAATKQGRVALKDIFEFSGGSDVLLRQVAIADANWMRFVEQSGVVSHLPDKSLIISGVHDKQVSLRRTKRWVAAEGLSWIKLSACGHFSMLDNPLAFAEIIKKSAEGNLS